MDTQHSERVKFRGWWNELRIDRYFQSKHWQVQLNFIQFDETLLFIWIYIPSKQKIFNCSFDWFLRIQSSEKNGLKFLKLLFNIFLLEEFSSVSLKKILGSLISRIEFVSIDQQFWICRVERKLNDKSRNTWIKSIYF